MSDPTAAREGDGPEVAPTEVEEALAPSSRGRDLGRSARRQLERTRAGRTALGFWAALDKHNGVLAASAMAFDAFLSVIPLLALAGGAVSAFGRPEHVEWVLVQLAPTGTRELLQGDVSRPVLDAFQLSPGWLGALAPLSFLVFLWLSSGGIATAIAVCESMYQAPARSYWARRALAMLWVLVGLIALVPLSFAFVGAAQLFGTVGGRAVALASAAPLLFFGVSTFFRTSIRRASDVRRRIAPGALLTVLLWVATTAAFSTYTTRLARYSLFYGSLAAVAMLLVWMWLLSLGLLVGGELNARLEGIRD